MGKKTTKSVAPKNATLTQEEFQKLSPDEQFALVTRAKEMAEVAINHASEAKAKLKADKKEEAVLPSFEVDDDKKNGIDGGTYDFTCPKFNHKGKTYDAAKVVEDSESDDEKAAVAASEILATLVARKSGIIQLRKED